MSQPLSRVSPKSQVMFYQGAINARPDLVPMIMHVIDSWSHIDLMLTKFLTRLLKADHIVVSAMMQGITSGEARRAALNGAVSAALRPSDIPIFEAVMRSVSPSRKIRNEFAHHIWGVSPDLPDALLLIDPKHMAAQSAVNEIRDKSPDSEKEKFSQAYDHSAIFVWRKGDFERQCKAANRAVSLIGKFHYGLHPTSAWRGLQHNELLSDPEVQQALQPKSRENNQPSQDK